MYVNLLGIVMHESQGGKVKAPSFPSFPLPLAGSECTDLAVKLKTIRFGFASGNFGLPR